MLGFAAFLKADLQYHGATYDWFHTASQLSFWLNCYPGHLACNGSLDQKVNLSSLPKGVNVFTNRKLIVIASRILSFLPYSYSIILLAKVAALLASPVKTDVGFCHPSELSYSSQC